MDYQTTAIFFDGKSSVNQTVELQVNVRLGEFQFVQEDGTSFVWELHDIHYEKYGSYLEIKNVKDSMAFLQVTDKEFIAQFLSHLKRKSKVGMYDRLLSLGFAKHLAIAVALIGLIVLGYIYVSPFVAEKSVALIPKSFDEYLGNTFMANFLTFNSTDQEKSAILNEFAQHLELNNTLPLEFFVVKSETVNAFALPSGNIVLYTGLLDKMESYEELAGLIGHEVEHVNQRHSLKMLCKNLAGYIFISAVLSDVNGIMAIIADNAHNLNSLSYSRKYEREADLNGTALMIQNNIDPKGMLKLFDRLQDDNTLSVPEFLSSHPITNDRIKYIEAYIQRETYETRHNEVLSELFEELKK